MKPNGEWDLKELQRIGAIMISQQECADYLNNAIENDLTIKEKNTLAWSINSDALGEAVLELVGDVTLFVEARDKFLK